MDFITSEMFLSLVGCLALVSMLTQVIKSLPLLNKINSAWSALLVSALVGVIRICFIGDFTVSGITLGVLNIFVIYLGAIGGYETIKQASQYFTKR